MLCVEPCADYTCTIRTCGCALAHDVLFHAVRVTGAVMGITALFLGFLVEAIFVALFSIVFITWKVCSIVFVAWKFMNVNSVT